MNVSQAARRTGLPAKTIRYYEEIGLVHPGRRGNGYRDFADVDIERLVFLRRARALGFSIDDCRDLMALHDKRDRASHDVKTIAMGHVSEIERRIAELEEMRRSLEALIEQCRGDDGPDCPILDDMAGGPVPRAA